MFYRGNGRGRRTTRYRHGLVVCPRRVRTFVKRRYEMPVSVLAAIYFSTILQSIVEKVLKDASKAAENEQAVKINLIHVIETLNSYEGFGKFESLMFNIF